LQRQRILSLVGRLIRNRCDESKNFSVVRHTNVEPVSVLGMQNNLESPVVPRSVLDDEVGDTGSRR
jgi:hypothetical protein